MSFQGKKVDARRVANGEGSSNPIYIGMRKGCVLQCSYAQSFGTAAGVLPAWVVFNRKDGVAANGRGPPHQSQCCNR